ncbi:MAG: site-specific DNA-methyltransferase [Burkholderiaceae bacterium]|nr:site-specific DNA-methyltransferase [Burkholderiaceae bacterium]
MNAPEFTYPPLLESQAYLGDCLEVLRSFPEASIDLIVTSPPYADQRASSYGGIKPDDYVDWFLPRAEQFLRVLKPRGSFVLNIKEKAIHGERHTYVLELILALRKQGWLWTEEYIWHKKNCYPGKWPNRFRDAWERCLHFTKQRQFKMNQDAVKVPMGDWAQTRLKSLGKNDVVRYDSQVGNAFAKNIANWQGRDMAYPTNVLHLATECSNKKHSAAFPLALPQWFIKLFTDQGDVVLDPFAGSGTSLQAAVELGRKAIGIDISPEYIRMCEETLAPAQGRLLEPRKSYDIDRAGKKIRTGTHRT